MRLQLLTCGLALLGLLAGGSAGAASIAWSTDNSNTIGGGGTAVDAGTIQAGSTGGQAGPGDFAGVVDQEYWGNSWNGAGQNFSPTNLIDSVGNQTTTDLTVSTGNTFAAGVFGVDSDGKWNRTMLAAYSNNV